MRRKMITHVIDKDGRHQIESKKVPPQVDALWELDSVLSVSQEIDVEDGKMHLWKGLQEEKLQIQLLQNERQFIKLGNKQGGPQEKLDKVVPRCTCCKMTKTKLVSLQECDKLGDVEDEDGACVPLV